MVTTEFDIIKRYFWKRPVSPFVSLGVGDDAAVLDIPSAYSLVTSIDSFNEGVHFSLTTTPYDIGYKSLAVSLSDMAAMGATPIAVQMALTLPHVDERWIRGFSEGFLNLAHDFSVDLIGGDTTSGPLSVSTVLYGVSPKGSVVQRQGACVGDDIYVSGVLGLAGYALSLLSDDESGVDASIVQALNRPVPRVALGVALRSYATSAIDVSDGLIADLNHVMSASHCGALIHCDALPLSPLMRPHLDLHAQWQYALTAGDDYELCFTAAPDQRDMIERCAKETATPCRRVGKVVEGEGVTLLDANGFEIIIEGSGYEHFSRK
jgi:thiamine-monophosphate kinase